MRKTLTKDGWVIDELEGRDLKTLTPQEVETLVKRANKIAKELKEANATIKENDEALATAGEMINAFTAEADRFAAFLMKNYPDVEINESAINTAISLLTANTEKNEGDK